MQGWPPPKCSCRRSSAAYLIIHSSPSSVPLADDGRVAPFAVEEHGAASSNIAALGALVDDHLVEVFAGGCRRRRPSFFFCRLLQRVRLRATACAAWQRLLFFVLVLVRSGAGLLATSAQHGCKTRAEARSLRVLALARLGASGCKTLASKPVCAVSAARARAPTQPGHAVASNASGEAPLLRIMGKESIPSHLASKAGPTGARGSPQAPRQQQRTLPPTAARARRYLRPCKRARAPNLGKDRKGSHERR